ncbi:unnamed protein product, partial [Prorocentrum cordatum]
ALTVLGGDFNYVATQEDRMTLATQRPSGRRDAGEEAHFQAALGRRHGLHELSQGEHTHAAAGSRARLDIIYMNFHAAEQLDRLLMFKATMKEVAFRLDTDVGRPPAATDLEDRLGVTMKFVRAVEQGLAGAISSCLERYPHLADLIDNPYDVSGNLSLRLHAAKRHAIALAREHALDELNKSHEDLAGPDPRLASQARQENARLLQRLAPGRAAGLSAVMANNGQVLTEPGAMAKELRQHWARVFTARGDDEQLLE